MSQLFISIYIKFFFLLTPFFVLSAFIAYTTGMEPRRQRMLALRVTLAVIVTCLILYHFGNLIFSVFGITVDAFRIGAGCLLFLSAVSLVRGQRTVPEDTEGDIHVVPLAIPITVGPATTGALLILGAGEQTYLERLVGSGALCLAVMSVGLMLVLAPVIDRLIGRNGLAILSKLTGLILSALAAQIVFTGIKNFLG